MANAEFLKVHHYRRVPGSTQVQLTRRSPYKAFVSQGQPTIFIREGKAFAEDGRPFDGGIPDWVSEILAKMPVKELAKLGFKKEDIQGNAAPQPEEAPQEASEEASIERREEASDTESDSGSNEAGQAMTGPLAERRARRART